MKIVIDAMGGDNAPKAIVEGTVKALEQIKDLQIVLTGNQEEIKKYLEKDYDRLEIVHCTQTIENNEQPSVAIRQKTDSSLVVALDYLKQKKADAVISAGSTGAILIGGFLKIGRIKGVSRPALAPILPAKNGGRVLLIDCGANVDSKPKSLVDFAIMGTTYMKIYGIENPRVALLNVGEEEGKGNELTKETYNLLKSQEGINFIGNREARDLLSGEIDVMVCDGFAGNIALKSTEGALSLVINEIKGCFTGFFGKLAGLLVYKKMKKIKDKLDYNKYGGSIFLGCNGIVLKSHGSSKTETIFSSIKQVIEIHNNKIIDEISNKMSERIIDNE